MILGSPPPLKGVGVPPKLGRGRRYLHVFEFEGEVDVARGQFAALPHVHELEGVLERGGEGKKKRGGQQKKKGVPPRVRMGGVSGEGTEGLSLSWGPFWGWVCWGPLSASLCVVPPPPPKVGELRGGRGGQFSVCPPNIRGIPGVSPPIPTPVPSHPRVTP